jgi:hypothetical protein
MQSFHPRGFRAMAPASAEDVRDVLARVDVPTLLVYGDHDVRAPLTVAEALQAAIAGSRLVVLREAGHVCNIEAPEEFNVAVGTSSGGGATRPARDRLTPAQRRVGRLAMARATSPDQDNETDLQSSEDAGPATSPGLLSQG